MSVSYRTVQWNRQKRLYDLVLFGGIVVFLGAFAGAQSLLHPEITAETLMIRGTALLALTLLHVILVIGPLARLDARFLPLLYNRRHLGVTMFLVALAHGGLSVLQFHTLGDTSPFVSLFVSNTRYDSVAQFPFQVLGFGALLVFFLMAATSHDFWLANLGPRFWKSLHMGVYGAYALVIAHVMLGSAQRDDSPGLVAMRAAGAVVRVGSHLAAGIREVRRDRRGDAATGEAGEAGDSSSGSASDRFVRVGPVDGIPDDRARVVSLGGERIAVFRYDGKVSAISNVCRHQNGPLGEGKVVDGCVTCPWHGFQYLPAEGRAPAPFTETIETYDVEIRGGDVYVDPSPKPPGTRTEPARIATSGAGGDGGDGEFYVGYEPSMPAAIAARSRSVVAGLFVLAVALPLAAVALQEPFPASRFEFGEQRVLEGRLVTRPVPALRIEVGRDAAGTVRHRLLPLVAAGKFGAEDTVAAANAVGDDLGERRVRIRGTLIFHDGRALLEVTDGASAFEAVSGDVPPAPEATAFGRTVLRGEIVDSKCYFGVMKPGSGKPHRSCAVRCLSGGIPPVLMMRDAEGRAAYAVLVGAEGEPVGRELLDFVAEPVEVRGELRQLDDWWFLAIDPEEVRRIDRTPSRRATQDDARNVTPTVAPTVTPTAG